MPELHDEWGCSRHPGVVACLGFESGPSGSPAEEGTEMHFLAEEIIKSGWKDC